MKTIHDAATERSIYYESNPYCDFKAGVEFAQQWISVEDELPEANIYVLAKCGKTYWVARLQPHGIGLTLYCIKGSRHSEEFEATHWRPIERK